MTRFDVIDDIKAYNDPNSCYQPSDEPLYTITEWGGTKLLHQTKDDVVDYVHTELFDMPFSINNAEDDDEAFEKAEEYLEKFSAIEKE